MLRKKSHFEKNTKFSQNFGEKDRFSQNLFFSVDTHKFVHFLTLKIQKESRKNHIYKQIITFY